MGDHGCEYMTNGNTVILGECGRNFAAGMSGGIAYVLDERGDFEDRCLQNANVDVEPFEAQADMRLVRDLIERHVAYTRSPKGQWVLEHWTSMIPLFKKIYPRELKRALREREMKRMAQGPDGGEGPRRSELGVARGPREWNHVSDVGHARDVADGTLEP